jgi:hypothetical protein
MAGYDVHIVGSVPLDDAAQVFEIVGAALGSRLPRIPDGETGDRLDWIRWLVPLYANNPAFAPADEEYRVHSAAKPMPRFRLKPGAAARDVRFDLPYAEVAAASYEAFKRARSAGKLAARCRFQVDLVPAHTMVTAFLREEDQAAVEPAYHAALLREIDRVAARIPHRDLAIQFDVASAVFNRLERGQPTRYGRTKAEMIETFAKEMIGLGDRVPKDADLVYHCCYGDNNHRHSIEPTDTGDMVAFANRVSAGIARPIQLFHMPVPRSRIDDAYFAPLKLLELRPETRLSLGLVHHTDGVAGTRRRIATAEKYVAGFMIATECGFGRRDPKTIPELLRIHAEVAGIG